MKTTTTNTETKTKGPTIIAARPQTLLGVDGEIYYHSCTPNLSTKDYSRFGAECRVCGKRAEMKSCARFRGHCKHNGPEHNKGHLALGLMHHWFESEQMLDAWLDLEVVREERTA